MPQRSKVYGLPSELRDELDKRLVEEGFRGYRKIAEWLQDKGYRISKSSVHAYGAKLEDDFERTMADVQKTQKLAKAFAAANTDEQGSLVGATARIASDSMLRIMMSLRESEDDPTRLAKLMPNITRALSELGRLSLSREKWVRDLREQDRAAAADRAEQTAKAKGISPDGISALRAAILEAV